MMADWIPVNERGGAQGLLWMSSRIGGADGAFAPGLADSRDGRLEGPARSDGLPGIGLVRGLLALVPEPSRGDVRGEQGGARDHHLGTSREAVGRAR